MCLSMAASVVNITHIGAFQLLYFVYNFPSPPETVRLLVSLISSTQPRLTRNISLEPQVPVPVLIPKYFYAVYDYAGKADLSKGYRNPKRKLG